MVKIPDTEALKKMGIFLIGLSLLIIAIVAVLFYQLVSNKSSVYESNYYVYCNKEQLDGYYIIINAYNDLRDVVVKNVNDTIFCTFDYIPKGSERVCFVGNSPGIYIVKSGYYEKIANCVEYYPPIRPLPQ
ncbi:MAG: hypothetical protein ACP5G1_01410 [Nanopusillaceae archaeon]